VQLCLVKTAFPKPIERSLDQGSTDRLPACCLHYGDTLDLADVIVEASKSKRAQGRLVAHRQQMLGIVVQPVELEG